MLHVADGRVRIGEQAIGLRISIENEDEARKSRERIMRATISEKRAELDRYGLTLLCVATLLSCRCLTFPFHALVLLNLAG